jgi:hypothetical protein
LFFHLFSQQVQQAVGSFLRVDTLGGGDFPGQTPQRGFVDHPLGVGTLGLVDVLMQVAHDFGDLDDVAGVDLGLVFLGAAAPHAARDARLALQRRHRRADLVFGTDVAQPRRGRAMHRHAQGHFLFIERNYEYAQVKIADLLGFFPYDPAHAVRGIYDMITDTERKLRHSVTTSQGLRRTVAIPLQNRRKKHPRRAHRNQRRERAIYTTKFSGKKPISAIRRKFILYFMRILIPTRGLSYKNERTYSDVAFC